jgi:hypothetical protein
MRRIVASPSNYRPPTTNCQNMNPFRMTDEVWRRHANPWSVYTRFAAIPAMVLAVWSRVWIGAWALVPVAVVVLWLVVNPFIFSPVDVPRNWASKGIYGERLWLLDRTKVPQGHRTILRRLIGMGLIGLALLAWGLWKLLIWPTIFGATLVFVAQLWRIDRMGLLYEQNET